MILNLHGDVGAEMLEALIKAINDASKESKSLTVYLTSNGGDVDMAECIIELLNSNTETVDVVFYGEVFSAAMAIYLRIKNKKRILNDTRGMYHFAWQQMLISEGGSPSDEYGKFSMNEMKKSKIRTIEFLKTTKMSEKEVTAIKKGKDVYFSYERMLELM